MHVVSLYWRVDGYYTDGENDLEEVGWLEVQERRNPLR